MFSKKKLLLILALSFILLLQITHQAQARENFRGAFDSVTRSMSIEQIKASKESCIQCHTKVTPMIVAQHQSSAHSKAGLTCQDCHGSDHSNMPIVTGKKVCAKCHAKETQDMIASKHFDSWSKMWNNARYLNQSKAIRQQACSRCHDISSGFDNVKDVRCDYCHSTHEFSVAEAKNPQVCNTCHMGPDHPQAEAYAATAHSKQSNLSCVTCHMSNGTHNVSLNMGLGGVSNGSVLDSWNWVMDSSGKPLLKRPVINQSQFDKARNGNLAICDKCHLPEFSRQWLDGADQVKMSVEQQLLQAQQIVQQLNKEGLLYPNPATRPANPVDGQKIVLGGNQLYNGTSKAEAIYFQMYKFAAATAFKSAYHQDFKRAGNEGILQMQVLMGELQDEAQTLRTLGPVATYEKEKAKEINQDKEPDYFIFGLLGFTAGLVLSVSIYLYKRKKGKWPAGFFILLLVIMATFSLPKQAMAWSSNPANQKQCSACHQQQQQQLKKGKHASLNCLDCHQQGAGLSQVRKPETCGKCHSGASGYQLETYTSSPHGVQYQVKGDNQWVPTCATCHLPQGTHNPISVISTGNDQFKGAIGEVCLKCHTTDKVVKFDQDKKDIDSQLNSLVNELKQVGWDLIDKGILIPENGPTGPVQKLREQWGSNVKWKMVNTDKLSPEEQEMARRIVEELDSKTKEGLNENAVKMKIGNAHINPDYMHWYGNAYLNLNLTKVKSTAKEIEMLAQKAGFSPEKSKYQKQLAMAVAIALGAALTGIGVATIVLRKVKR